MPDCVPHNLHKNSNHPCKNYRDYKKPDIAVDLTPADEFGGKDPQLDKAVEVAIQKIKDARNKPKVETPAKPEQPAKTGDFEGEQDQGKKEE